MEDFAWKTNLATEIESTGEKEEREHWGRRTVGDQLSVSEVYVVGWWQMPGVAGEW